MTDKSDTCIETVDLKTVDLKTVDLETDNRSKYDIGSTEFTCDEGDRGNHLCYVDTDCIYIREDPDVSDEIYSESSDDYDLTYLKKVTNIKYSLGSSIYELY